MKTIPNILACGLLLLMVSSCLAQETSKQETVKLINSQLAELETAYLVQAASGV